MKKIIVFILLFIFFTQANAVYLSTNGTGQVLLFPYYTVNGDFNTLITLTNTTNGAKALRVRFREAANSREVFTFNLYLGPNDIWTGALVKGSEDEDSFTKIISNDVSCTVPSMQSNLFYKDKFTGDMVDVYGDETLRMHEGFIEVIEMGVLTGDSANAVLVTNDVVFPADCLMLQNAWNVESDNSYWLDDSNIDLSSATGGITGDVILINVADGIAVSEQATVLADFNNGILHSAIGSDSPNLADGDKIATIVGNNGDTYETTWQTGFEAVSAVLMKTTIVNEFVLDDAIGAETDWIISLPTRQFHIDTRIAAPETTPIAPFTFTTNAMSLFCENADYAGIYDRETQTPQDGIIIIGTPPPPPLFDHQLCYSTNATTVTKVENNLALGSGIFASNHPINPFLVGEDIRGRHFKTEFDNGWISLIFQQITQANNENIKLEGLPIIGFSTQKYVNGNLGGGVLANYAESFKHKNTVIIDSEIEALEGMKIAKENIGQVLLYPYYTVRNGFDALITIVNTTDKVKALKIKFREGKNARNVLDFNLYLSPYDVWVAALVANLSTVVNHFGEQSVKLITSDSSCTVPVITNVNNGLEFLPYGYDPQDNGNLAEGYDGLGTSLKRAQEGFMEIIEMGELSGDDALAATHIMGVPASCHTLSENWTPPNGKWHLNSDENLNAPNGLGGLYGSLQLINVANGTDMGYEATAIVGFSSEVTHTFPGDIIPNLASGNQSKTLIETDEGIIQTTWNSPLDAVSALFMQQSVANDYVISDGIGAQTDWVNTYPTKQFYVDPMFVDGQAPLEPFSQILIPELGACEDLSFTSFDRNQQENYNSSLVGVIPPGVNNPKNCWSTNVAYAEDNTANGALINNSQSIFNSNLLINNWITIAAPLSIYGMEASEGWMKMSLSSSLEGAGESGEIHTIYGKPVIGFAAQKYVNGTLDNGQGGLVLANYAVINRNKARRHLDIALPAKK